MGIVKLFEYWDSLIFVFLMLCLFFFIGKTWSAFIQKALCEQTGVPSHKRLVTFLFSVLGVVVILWAVIFKASIPDNVMWFLASIILGGMGLAASIDIASFFQKKSPETKE